MSRRFGTAAPIRITALAPWLLVALLLLGIGWNFGFVGGSALLTDCLPAGERVRGGDPIVLLAGGA